MKLRYKSLTFASKLFEVLQSSALGGTIIVFSLMLPFLEKHRDVDPDLFARVAVGHIIASTGWVAYTDPFSFTAPHATWIDHEWLSGYIFFLLSQIGGDFALFLFKVLMLFLFLFATTKTHILVSGKLHLIPYVFSIFFTYYLWLSTVRCQIFTYTLLSVFFLLIAQSQQRISLSKYLLFSLLMVLWTNLHGGFVLGLFFLGLFWLSRVIERKSDVVPLGICLVCTIFLTLCNPYGFSYWQYMFDALMLPRTFVPEWDSVSLFSPVGFLMTLTMLIVTHKVVMRERALSFQSAALIASYLLGMWHLRLAGIFFIVVSIWGAQEISNFFTLLPHKLRKVRSALEMLTITLSIVFGSSSLFSLCCEKDFQLDYSKYPVGATEWLAENAKDTNLLNGFTEGSYLLWKLAPVIKISLDGRYEEVYSNEVVDRVRCIYDTTCTSSSEMLLEISPDYALVSNKHLKNSKLWDRFGPHSKICYQDEDWTVIKVNATQVSCERPNVGSNQPTPETLAKMWVRKF